MKNELDRPDDYTFEIHNQILRRDEVLLFLKADKSIVTVLNAMLEGDEEMLYGELLKRVA